MNVVTLFPAEPLAQRFDKHGKAIGPAQTVQNWLHVLNGEPFEDKIRFNLFSRRIERWGVLPWSSPAAGPWTDADSSALFCCVQAVTGLSRRQDCLDALTIAAHEREFNPLTDTLDSLPYAGPGHVDSLLTDYLGADATPYNRAALRLFMRGAVARAFLPGVKFDSCLILQGPQGCGKSTFLARLAMLPEFFCDSLDSLDGKSAAELLQGCWICELSELKSLARTAGGIDSVKRFLSAQSDKYRPAYGRFTEDRPRQCVFAGTTNRTDFLTDTTGNRRFYVLPCGRYAPAKDLWSDAAAQDIAAAWAEIVSEMRPELNAGKVDLRFPADLEREAEEQRGANQADDGSRGLILSWLDERPDLGTRICALQIWRECLHEEGRPPRATAAFINDVVRSTGEWTSNGPATITGNNGQLYGKQRGFSRTLLPAGSRHNEFLPCPEPPFASFSS